MEKEEAQTIYNITMTAERRFEKIDEKIRFIQFMMIRFGGSYQDQDYCDEWATRIINKATGAMDGHTHRIYNQIYEAE